MCMFLLLKVWMCANGSVFLKVAISKNRGHIVIGCSHALNVLSRTLVSERNK